MPHAAFYVVQRYGNIFGVDLHDVSMPHAALYVVQPKNTRKENTPPCFNAARSILCGATTKEIQSKVEGYVSMPHAAFYVVQH